MAKKIKEKEFVVYKVSNNKNDKVYIGKTNEFKRRLKEHKYHSKTGNVLLYRAIRKHGLENFKFEIIEVCTDEDHLKIREMFWIKYYKSFGKHTGYNASSGGENISYSEESIDKMRSATYAVPPYGGNKKYKGVYLDCGTYCYRFVISEKVYTKGGYRTEHEAAWGRDVSMREMLPNFAPFLNFPSGKTDKLIKEQISTSKLIESVKYTHGKIRYQKDRKMYSVTVRDIFKNRIFETAMSKTMNGCEENMADFISKTKSIFIPKKPSITSIQKSWEDAYGPIYGLFTEDYFVKICTDEIGTLI